uniref:Uncharacterized protein n=1 Tax=Mycena chlorophos TaxID=658473 RepID=A0ABQ0LFZ4_MYCCL|nr:predicted protein [Mycena chlorophos]
MEGAFCRGSRLLRQELTRSLIIADCELAATRDSTGLLRAWWSGPRSGSFRGPERPPRCDVASHSPLVCLSSYSHDHFSFLHASAQRRPGSSGARDGKEASPTLGSPPTSVQVDRRMGGWTMKKLLALPLFLPIPYVAVIQLGMATNTGSKGLALILIASYAILAAAVLYDRKTRLPLEFAAVLPVHMPLPVAATDHGNDEKMLYTE